MFWVFLTTLLSLTTALQWTDSLTNNTVMTVCSASDIHLPWNFTLSPDERIADIKWIYRVEDGSELLIALYAAGQFTSLAAFHGRVQWTGQGGIVVSQAAVAESGNYTIIVSTEDSSNHLVKFSKTVYVQVADPPTAESGRLHVLQEQGAVFDNMTCVWRVELTCGDLTSRGHPAVDVVWTSPDGHTVESSSEHNGTFRLLLPNPPSGGNYTCTLPPLSPATRCLPPLSPLLGGATVTVDEVKTSFALLDARQRETEARLEAMQRETEAKQRETEAMMKTELESVKSENSQLRGELTSLQTRLNAANKRVSFHAKLRNDLNNVIGVFQPFDAITNEGGAFNVTTGIFTTTRSGTYFFVVSAGTNWSSSLGDNVINVELAKEDRRVALTYARQYSSYSIAATCHATLHLNVGERVWVVSRTILSTFYFHESTYFTGFMVGADDW